jgi:hypothetical protein
MDGMGLQIRPFLVEPVVKLQVQMVCLQIHEDEDRWNRPGEFAKGFKDIIGLEGYAFLNSSL